MYNKEQDRWAFFLIKAALEIMTMMNLETAIYQSFCFVFKKRCQLFNSSSESVFKGSQLINFVASKEMKAAAGSTCVSV